MANKKLSIIVVEIQYGDKRYRQDISCNISKRIIQFDRIDLKAGTCRPQRYLEQGYYNAIAVKRGPRSSGADWRDREIEQGLFVPRSARSCRRWLRVASVMPNLSFARRPFQLPRIDNFYSVVTNLWLNPRRPDDRLFARFRFGRSSHLFTRMISETRLNNTVQHQILYKVIHTPTIFSR